MAGLGPGGIMVLWATLSFVLPWWRVWPVLVHGFLHVTTVSFERPRCECPAGAVGDDHAKHAIYMVVKDGEQDMALNTIKSVHTYFNGCFRKHVHVFHYSNVPIKVQELVKKRYPQVTLHKFINGTNHWHVAKHNPKNKNQTDIVYRDALARWYNVGVFDFLHERGYEWAMRIDPYLRMVSCMRPDPFKFMQSSGFLHGYRVMRPTAKSAIKGMPELLQSHLQREGRAVPPRLFKHFQRETLTMDTWDGDTFDQSYFITNVSFWRAPAVRSWMATTLRHNANHAPGLHTLTLLAYLREDQMHHFKDWSYLSGGVLAVPLQRWVPSVFSSLVPAGSEWTSDLNVLRADSRYTAEVAWLQSNILKPVNDNEYWCFRFLKYIR